MFRNFIYPIAIASCLRVRSYTVARFSNCHSLAPCWTSPSQPSRLIASQSDRCEAGEQEAAMSTTTGLTGPPQPPPRTVRQDVAPKGGYAPINVARNVPKSVGTAAGGLLLVGTAAMMSYGFYRLGNFNVKRRCVLRKFGNTNVGSNRAMSGIFLSRLVKF